jgi:hypothetical protein
MSNNRKHERRRGLGRDPDANTNGHPVSAPVPLHIVDEALAIVFTESPTIDSEAQAVSDQLHSTEAYHEFLSEAAGLLAYGMVEDDFHQALCGVVVKAVYLGKKLSQMEAAREAVAKEKEKETTVQ